MRNKNLTSLKKKLMQPNWTEDLHHSLEELEPEQAKFIVDSMTDSEIYSKINIRKSQEDYIADYIEYLWEISEDAYWKHIVISLDTSIGILWGDNMLHFQRLCSIKIPVYVLNAVLYFAVNCDEKNIQDYNAIGCVIKAQIKKFKVSGDIKKYILTLEKEKQESAMKRISHMKKEICNYSFYY